MIVNLWSKIRLICGNHEGDNPPHMEPHEAASSNISRSLYGNSSMNMFYSCPKYYPDQREPDEACCRNHISMKEFENMLSHISSILEEGEKNGKVINLVGTSWISRAGVKYRVLKHTDKHIDVWCLDEKKLWK